MKLMAGKLAEQLGQTFRELVEPEDLVFGAVEWKQRFPGDDRPNPVGDMVFIRNQAVSLAGCTKNEITEVLADLENASRKGGKIGGIMRRIAEETAGVIYFGNIGLGRPLPDGTYKIQSLGICCPTPAEVFRLMGLPTAS